MIEIALTQGYVARIDDCDAHLAGFKWHVWTSKRKTTNVYAVRSAFVDGGRKVTLYLHREVMGEAAAGLPVDHIDGDGLNCCRSNLRAVTQAVNMRNVCGAMKNSTTGLLGVYRVASGKFVAMIQHEGKLRNLGRYMTVEEANAARLSAERELWGVEPRRATAHG